MLRAPRAPRARPTWPAAPRAGPGSPESSAGRCRGSAWRSPGRGPPPAACRARAPVRPGARPRSVASPGPQVAYGEEGLPQQRLREAGPQRGEQGGAGGLGGIRSGKPVRPDLDAFLGAPSGLAIERAEGHGQHGPLLQRLLARVADDRPTRRVQLDLARVRLGARAVGQPEDALAVGALQRARQQQADGGALQQGQDGARPGARLVLARFGGRRTRRSGPCRPGPAGDGSRRRPAACDGAGLLAGAGRARPRSPGRW